MGDQSGETAGVRVADPPGSLPPTWGEGGGATSLSKLEDQGVNVPGPADSKPGVGMAESSILQPRTP